MQPTSARPHVCVNRMLRRPGRLGAEPFRSRNRRSTIRPIPNPDEKGAAVAVKVVYLSDLTGRHGDKSEFGDMEVRHPDFREPIHLEVLPSEIESLLKSATRVVQVDYSAPGARASQRLFVLVDDFDAVAGDRDMKAILMEALTAMHAERARAAGDGRKTARAGGAGQGKVNYATLEHAGEPHRGKITEAERNLVRGNLEQINARLAAAGMRTIDPADPKMRERYGL